MFRSIVIRAAVRRATAGIVLGVMGYGLVAALPARADLPSMRGEVARLRTELEAIQNGVQLVQAADPGRLARFEVRLGQLEEELRRLTGRIEQLEFGQSSTEARVDRLIQDLDQRLHPLEQASGALAGSTPEGATTAPDPSIAAAVAPPRQRQPSEGALGSVPQSAVLDLPKPDPSTIAPPPEIKKLSAQQQYDSAIRLLRAGDYLGAQRGLELFLDMNADDTLAPNAAYWLGESHYVRQDYASAAAAFARNYRTYGKDAAKAVDNLLKLGMSLHSLGESDKACLSYAELAKEFPDAPAHIRQALARERDRAECA